MIKPLTSFRFIAALAVFFSHLSILKGFEHTSNFYNTYFYEGYIGVTFFFILSGFILTYTYYNIFETVTKDKLKKFYQSRLARIYPLYLLTFAIAIPVTIISNEGLTQKILSGIANIFMLQSLIPNADYYFSYNSPSWSISNEVFFYSLMPIFMIVLHRCKKFLNIRIIILVIMAVWLISLGYVYTFRDSTMSHWLFYISPFFRVVDFSIGILLGVMYLKVRSKESSLNINTFTFLEVVSILALVVALYFSPEVHQSFRYGTYYLPFMVSIIWIFSFQKGAISKFLSHKLFIYLGEISFAFYLIHQLVIRYLGVVPGLESQPILFSVIAFAVSMVSSHVLFKWYETPARHIIKNSSITNRENTVTAK